MKNFFLLNIFINIVFSKKISYENNKKYLLGETNLFDNEDPYEEIKINGSDIIEIENNKTYLFKIENKSNVYFYESEIENIFQFSNKTFCNKICYINDQEIFVNINKTLTNSINITVVAYKL